MRSSLVPFLSPLIAAILAGGAMAQMAPQVDVKSMLQGLDQLKHKQQLSAHSQLSNTIAAFSGAASTDEAAEDFFLEAVRVTQFVGQPHEQTAFQAWRKREVGKLKPEAIRVCLQYMILSLQRAAGATDRQIYPGVLGYAVATQKLLPDIGDDQIMRQEITNNIFSKWYGLGDQLDGLDNWAMAPGDVDGIYTKFLLPIMRKYRDPRILAYWDARIAAESTQASMGANAFNADRFNQTRLPELLWARAEDVIAIGAREQGLSTMYSIIKNYPNHTSEGKWIDELKSLLTNPAGSGTDGGPAAPAQAGQAAPPAPDTGAAPAPAAQ